MSKSAFASCILHSAFCISMASAAIRFDADSAEIVMATNAPKSVAFANLRLTFPSVSGRIAAKRKKELS